MHAYRANAKAHVTAPDDRLQAHLRLGGHEAEAARHSGAIEHFTEALALANSEGLDATDVHSALARSLMLTENWRPPRTTAKMP